ncbi:MAG: glycosyl hydrolase [Phycisphaerales bacterium]|nr:glycosyl hydrolase [Phycisphaerales bacterium]
MNTQMSSLQLPRFAICCLIVLAIALPVRGDYPNISSIVHVGGSSVFKVNTTNDSFNLPGPSTTATQDKWTEGIEELVRVKPRIDSNSDLVVTTNKWWSALLWPDLNQKGDRLGDWPPNQDDDGAFTGFTESGHRKPYFTYQAPWTISSRIIARRHNNDNQDLGESTELLQGSLNLYHSSWFQTQGKIYTFNGAFTNINTIYGPGNDNCTKTLQGGRINNQCCPLPVDDWCSIKDPLLGDDDPFQNALWITPCGVFECEYRNSSDRCQEMVYVSDTGPSLTETGCKNALIQMPTPQWSSHINQYGGGQAFMLGVQKPNQSANLYFDKWGENITEGGDQGTQYNTNMQSSYELWYQTDGGKITDYHDLGCTVRYTGLNIADDSANANQYLDFHLTSGTPYIWGTSGTTDGSEPLMPVAILPAVSRYSDIGSIGPEPQPGQLVEAYACDSSDLNLSSWIYVPDPNGSQEWVNPDSHGCVLAPFGDQVTKQPMWENLGRSVVLVLNSHADDISPQITNKYGWGEPVLYGYYLQDGYTWCLEPILANDHIVSIFCADRVEYRLVAKPVGRNANAKEIDFSVALIGYLDEVTTSNGRGKFFADNEIFNTFKSHALNHVDSVDVTYSIAGGMATTTFSYTDDSGNAVDTIINTLPHHRAASAGSAGGLTWYAGINGVGGDATLRPEVINNGSWTMTTEIPGGLPILPPAYQNQSINDYGVVTTDGFNLDHLANLMKVRYSSIPNVNASGTHSFTSPTMSYAGDFRTYGQWNNLYEWYKYLSSLADDLLILQMMDEIQQKKSWSNLIAPDLKEELQQYANDIHAFLQSNIDSQLTAVNAGIFCEGSDQCNSGRMPSLGTDEAPVPTPQIFYPITLKDFVTTSNDDSEDVWNTPEPSQSSHTEDLELHNVNSNGQWANVPTITLNKYVAPEDAVSAIGPAYPNDQASPQIAPIVSYKDYCQSSAQCGAEQGDSVIHTERVCLGPTQGGRVFNKKGMYCIKIEGVDLTQTFIDAGSMKLQLLLRQKYNQEPAGNPAGFGISVWMDGPMASEGGTLLSQVPFTNNKFGNNCNAQDGALVPLGRNTMPWTGGGMWGAAQTNATAAGWYKYQDTNEETLWGAQSIQLFYPLGQPGYDPSNSLNQALYVEPYFKNGSQIGPGVKDLYVVIDPGYINTNAYDSWTSQLEIAGFRMVGLNEQATYGNFLYYDTVWDTLFMSPQNAFQCVTQKNDNHFIMGYFLNIFAKLAMNKRYRDRSRDGTGQSPAEQWIDSRGPGIELIARDIANWSTPDPKNDALPLPRMRYFDPYFGHSMASGSSAGDSGNNEESLSEDINWTNGLILAGSILSNGDSNSEYVKMLQAGQWQKSLIYNAASQWFNPDNSYGAIPSGLAHSGAESSLWSMDYNSIVEGGVEAIPGYLSPVPGSKSESDQYYSIGQVWSLQSIFKTFFNYDPVSILAIQCLPTTAGHLLPWGDTEFVTKVMQDFTSSGRLASSSSVFNGKPSSVSWTDEAAWPYGISAMRAWAMASPTLVQTWIHDHSWGGIVLGHPSDPYTFDPDWLGNYYGGNDPDKWVPASWYNSFGNSMDIGGREVDRGAVPHYNWNTPNPVYTGTSYPSDYHFVWSLGKLGSPSTSGIGGNNPVSATFGDTTYVVNMTSQTSQGLPPGSTGVDPTQVAANIDHLLSVLSDWSTDEYCPNCLGDHNADSVVDINDLVLVLDNWIQTD